MAKPKNTIPYYTEINDFFEAIPWPGRTTNPAFFCLRLQKLNEQLTIYRPPFKRSFYFFALLRNTGKIRVNYDDNTVEDPEAYLVFHSPGLVYSFSHNNELEGYLIYFKSECFDFFKPGFHNTFPVFDPLQTNLFKLDSATFNKLAPHFEEVLAAYERTGSSLHLEARLKLLALLCHMKEFAADRRKAVRFASPQQILLNRFLQLVNSHYIDKQTVKEYADLLSVTPNHLSQAIKAASGKNALQFIADRLTVEAKSLVQYTSFNVTEIAYQLGFSDAANFSKFFRKQTGASPSDFRKHKAQ